MPLISIILEVNVCDGLVWRESSSVYGRNKVMTEKRCCRLALLMSLSVMMVKYDSHILCVYISSHLEKPYFSITYLT